MLELAGRISGRLRSLSWPHIAAVVLPIVAGMLYGLWEWNRYQDYYGRLDAFGVETPARVIAKYTGTAGNARSGAYHRMQVEFSVDNTLRRGVVDVTRRFFKRHDAPDRVPIRYLPEDPQIRELDPRVRRKSVKDSIAIVVIFLFIGLANGVMGVGKEEGRRAQARGGEEQ